MDNYPESNLLGTDESDFDFAYALGSFLFQPDRQILLVQTQEVYDDDPFFPDPLFIGAASEHVTLWIDVAKLEKVIYEEVISVPADITEPQSSLRKKLEAFLKRTLDMEMLKTELASAAKGNGRVRLLELSKLHKIVAKCALSHLAVVSIDITILKWVVLASRDESIKPHIFKIGKLPIVGTFLCNALVSLMFYSEVKLYVEEELNEFMCAMKKLPQLVFNPYGCSVASLLLPLPEDNYRKVLTEFISGCEIQQYADGNPGVALSDMLITLLPDKVNELKVLRESGELRILLGASLGSLKVTTESFSFDTQGHVCYTASMLNGGKFKNGELKLVNGCGKVTFYDPHALIGESCDVLVCTLIPLSKDILELLGRYARGVAMSERDCQDILYAQAAYGISMIIAPRIAIAISEGRF